MDEKKTTVHFSSTHEQYTDDPPGQEGDTWENRYGNYIFRDGRWVRDED